MPEREITSGGRRLTVYDDGDPSGPAILVHHGTPGAGPPYAGCVDDARQRGARLIAYDRPGYGASAAAPDRSIADAATDAAAILDALEVERCVTWGISGGGPHALACAALLGDRVDAVATLGGVAPFDAPGLNYFSGMGQDNLVEFGLAMAGREHITPFLELAARDMLAHLDEMAVTIASLVSEPDRIALTGPIGQWWSAGIPVCFAHGTDGWIDDDLAFVRPFGFELTAIRVPTLIVHGHQDLFVPLSHGQWLSQAISGAESWLEEEEAHLSLLAGRLGDVHAWLLGHV